jgi:YHS domain-containing protein
MKRNLVAIILIAAVAVVSMTAFAQARKPPEKVRDPVCGMMVEKNPEFTASHKGDTYYFCSKADMETFKKNPDKYAKKP